MLKPKVLRKLRCPLPLVNPFDPPRITAGSSGILPVIQDHHDPTLHYAGRIGELDCPNDNPSTAVTRVALLPQLSEGYDLQYYTLRMKHVCADKGCEWVSGVGMDVNQVHEWKRAGCGYWKHLLREDLLLQMGCTPSSPS